MMCPRKIFTFAEPELACGHKRARPYAWHARAMSAGNQSAHNLQYEWPRDQLEATAWGSREVVATMGSLWYSLQPVCRAYRRASIGRIFWPCARRQAIVSSDVIQPPMAIAGIECKRLVLQAAHRQPWRRRARPNPSVKRSANGRPPGPRSRYGVHFLLRGPGVLPLAPAYLER